MHVGSRQRHANFAQRPFHVFRPDFPSPRKILEYALKFVAKFST